MELNSIQIQIFVSCPRDVNEEKRIVSEVCEIVNKDLLQMGCKIQYLVRDFTEIVGQTGKRPQQIINDDIKGYHIYFGILHMRFGMPTGATDPTTGLEFESGTKEEFEVANHRRTVDKEPVEIYFFFKDPRAPTTLDESQQLVKVLTFKESLMKGDWINPFKNQLEFERKIRSKLTTSAINICREESIQAKNEFVKDNLGKINFAADDNSVKIDSLLPELPELEYYLDRSVTEFGKSGSNVIALFKEEIEKLFLKEILSQEKRVVILGNAGSGKSVELQQTANYFSNKDTQFIPVYKRFNTYVDQNIEDFLPQDWKKVNSNLLVIFLDGLDEIQPQNFNTAVRKLLFFSEQYPDLRIVISCRTNFYELPSNNFSGTLTNFRVYILNDVSLSEVNDYLTKELKMDGEKFIQDAYDSSLLDILQKPFFLNILIKHYKAQNDFSVGRATIIEEFVLSMIDSDQEHFKSSIPIQKSKQEILSLLEKVAFIMEYLGKNYFTQNELESVLSDSNEREQIKRFSAFSKDPNKAHWMFEHNNIQEFLASRVLARQKFDDLIKLISFPPSYNKLKPNWINTLSFLISIGSKELRDRVIDWLVNIEPEVLVKFERERVTKELRIKIFKEIFNFYKLRRIWISSNKFNDNDLARFGAYKEILDFLVGEIENVGNARIVRLNAIHVLDNFDVVQLALEDKEKIKSVVLNIISSETVDPYFVFSMLYGLAKLEITDIYTIEYVVDRYRKSKNQYIRASLYKLINAAKKQDDYIHIYLEGLALDEIEEGVNDREAVNLSDESWQLEEGLKQLNSSKSLRKLLAYFTVSVEDDSSGLRHERIYNQSEIFKSLLNKLFVEYRNDETLFDDIYRTYINLIRRYDNNYLQEIASFFVSIGKDWEVFKKIWFDTSIKDYDRYSTIENIVSDTLIEHFIGEYNNRNFSNADAVSFHSILIWKYPVKSDKFYLVENFEQQVNKLSSITFERPRFIDWQAIQKKQNQASLDSLFDTSILLKEVKDIFEIIGKEQITFNDTWDIRRKRISETEVPFLASATDLIRDFTIHDRSVSYDQIESFVLNNKRYSGFLIQTLHNLIKNDTESNLHVSEEQLAVIRKWCEEIASNTNLKTAVFNDESFNGISVNKNAQYLWFFLNHFMLSLPINKLLDFTLFYQFKNGSGQDEAEVIEALESFTEKKVIEERVIQNLSDGIDVVDIWVSNAAYAIQNNLKSAYPSILNNLSNFKMSEYNRAKVLKLFFNKTKDTKALHALLKKVYTDPIRWYIIDILIEDASQSDYLKTYLKRLLNSDIKLRDEKLNAAKYLMRLNDIEGLNFIGNLILKEKDPHFDFSRNIGTVSKIQSKKAIPILLKLLKLAKQPFFKTDRFNDLESYVLDTFHSIGIQSDNNFLAVKKSLENFIQTNQDKIEHVNFIYTNIRRIEEQLYLNQSRNYSIGDAIKEYSQL